MSKIEEVYFFTEYFWIKDRNHQKCLQILKDFQDIFKKAPGSRKSHHNHEGGYLDHIVETFWLASHLYQVIHRECIRKYQQKPIFTVHDAYLVLFLHDIEKPFKYIKQKDTTKEEFEETKRKLATKKGREQFRLDLINYYGIELTAQQQNALKYIEGENNDYVPGERVMNELAAFCHACDILSARILWDKSIRSSPDEIRKDD